LSVIVDGIINVLKPPGMTSHDVIYRIRRLTGIKRCGHTGTLDPGAAGILPVCVGSATRVSEYVLDMDKSYRAELTLGTSTDTEDASGTVIEQKEIPELGRDSVRQVLQQFMGRTSQIPPMYSALRKGGVKLYELARRGETVEREPRQITVYRLELLRIINNKILFEADCSRGTYIRTLCADIASQLGTCGHMSFLLRVAVGPFRMHNCFTLEELARLGEEGSLDKALLPSDTALLHYPSVTVTPAKAEAIMHGRAIEYSPDNATGLPIRVYRADGEMIAIARASEGKLLPKKVFINRAERG
jgi:tRNA pseudouridine55 synthase